MMRTMQDWRKIISYKFRGQRKVGDTLNWSRQPADWHTGGRNAGTDLNSSKRFSFQPRIWKRIWSSEEETLSQWKAITPYCFFSISNYLAFVTKSFLFLSLSNISKHRQTQITFDQFDQCNRKIPKSSCLISLSQSKHFLDTQASLEPTPVSQLVNWSVTLSDFQSLVSNSRSNKKK